MTYTNQQRYTRDTIRNLIMIVRKLPLDDAEFRPSALRSIGRYFALRNELSPMAAVRDSAPRAPRLTDAQVEAYLEEHADQPSPLFPVVHADVESIVHWHWMMHHFDD